MQPTFYICKTCGVQYNASVTTPTCCPICEDDRQYVKEEGQAWTTLEEINASYKNVIERIADHVYAIYTTPTFAIGQRAHLIQTPSGNILWDCIANLDADTITRIKELGGIKAIALSHPHYFSTIVEWSQAFDHAPVHINALDAQWLGRTDKCIQLWSEATISLWDNIQLVRCGGHFPGASILYWPAGKGALFVGDTIQVAPTRKTVSFMYSYPNMIPLPKREILNIQTTVTPLVYDAMYGAFGQYIRTDAQAAMDRSVKRYLEIFE
jgi:hypothetical protein